ncbi:MAG: hypothetical protein M1817_000480 [Caeruleum heppii]|nr:MAG: hypothetical protein M1817_000480 [Caeruleum heppii]
MEGQLGNQDAFGRSGKTMPRRNTPFPSQSSWSNLGQRDVSTTSAPLGTGAIVGIAIGGAVLLFVTLSLIIVLSVRLHHNKKLAGNQRRLSVYPGGNTNIEAAPESRPSMSHPAGHWTPRRSQDRRAQMRQWPDSNSHERRLLASTEDLLRTSSAGSRDRSSARLSWPVRRSKSSRLSIPLQHVRAMRLSPITESPLSRSKSTPELNAILEHGPSMDEAPQSRTASFVPYAPRLSTNFDPRTFHRDKGYSNISRNDRTRVPVGQRSKSDNFSTYPSSASVPDAVLRPTKSERKPTGRHRPDSWAFGLTEYQPGSAPKAPMPRLPADAEGLNIQARRMRSSDLHQDGPGSVSSVESASSSVLYMKGTSPFSRQSSKRNSKPPSVPSSPLSSRTSDGMSIFERRISHWENAAATGLTSPSKHRNRSSSTKKSNNPVRRSNSIQGETGLSNSGRLIREGSRVSLATLGARHSRHVSLDVFGDPQGEGSLRNSRCSTGIVPATPPTTPLDDEDSKQLSVVTASHLQPALHSLSHRPEDYESPHRPPSVLRDVSGNQIDPFQFRNPPRGSSSSPGQHQNLFTWDPKMALQQKPASVLKGSNRTRSGHRRQNGVRISALAPTIMGPFVCSPMSEEPDSAQSTPTTALFPRPRVSSRNLATPPGTRPKGARPLPRPPSAVKFDPRSSPTPRRKRGRQSGQSIAQEAPYSPTLSMYNYYNSPDSRPPSEVSLDDEPPNKRLSTDSSIFRSPVRAHPSRAESIAGSITSIQLDTPSRIHHGGQVFSFPIPQDRKNSNRLLDSPTQSHSGPSPLILSTMSPTHSTTFARQAQRERYQFTIRGPRTPPFKRTSRNANDAKELRRSIVMLRRMNSEISTSGYDEEGVGADDYRRGSRSSRRYLALGNVSESGDNRGTIVSPTNSIKSAPRTFTSSRIPQPSWPLPTDPTRPDLSVEQSNYGISVGSSRSGTLGRTDTGSSRGAPGQTIATRDSKNFVMPSPRTDGLRGLGLAWVEEEGELYDGDGFLVA